MWERKLELDHDGTEKYLIVAVPGVQLREYDPWLEEPQAYLAFARLRSDLSVAGARAMSADDQWDRLLPFIERYGPPFWSRDAGGQLGFPLQDAMDENELLAVGVMCYRWLTADRPGLNSTVRRCLQTQREKGKFLSAYSVTSYYDGDLAQQADLSSDEGLLLAARAWLLDTMNSHPNALKGIHSQLDFHPKNAWQPSYWYQNLVNLLWLQLYQAMLKRSPVRECVGCQELFNPSRTNQEYHDVYCRGATNARRTYQRRRGVRGR